MNTHPVAIIGAGPVGLAAAAHLHARGLPFVILEAGAEPGHAMRQWAHVRMFSPWRFNLDKESVRLLAAGGWVKPAEDDIPTGGEVVDNYLRPLAAHPAIAPHLRLGVRVLAVGRDGWDKVRSEGRDRLAFALDLDDGTRLLARAVIDASGTWFQPNPLGSAGRALPGERGNHDAIAHGIPDVAGAERASYAGRRVLVVGGGHSAFNVVLDLLKLKESAPATQVHWAMRRDNLDRIAGGGAADALPARGALGLAVDDAIRTGKVSVHTPFLIDAVERAADGVVVSGRLRGAAGAVVVDRVVVATGFRPDLDMLREVRLELDPWLECARDLGPLIDPNLHSCGTVRPHGARELAHPDKDFFIVGMKSYGRAPTFLMATGYEQVRSVAAQLAGDHAAAARVELELPETGVCSAPAVVAQADSACCAPKPKKTGCCG